MYVAFYISSHGFGHMTRCLSLMKNILKTTEYKLYIVCDKKQNNFASIYLSEFEDRVIYKDMVTDVGLVNKFNSLEVDKIALSEKLVNFISCWDDIVRYECEFLSLLDVVCVVSDISPIGCMVGDNLQLPTVFVSNFSWVDQYEYIGIDDSIISKFRYAYSCVSKLIKYGLCMDMSSIDANEIYNVGFVCRDIDEYRVSDIKSEFGSSIFITCGKSASLSCINVNNFEGTIFTTSGIDIICDMGCNVVKLPIEVLDTQNYIAASDMVIAKAGWGTIAEGVLGHTPLVLIERPSAREDSFNIDEVKARGLGISVSEEELAYIDVYDIRKKLDEYIDYERLGSYKNDVDNLWRILI